MLEARGNLWDFNGVHVITTNGFVKKDGSAVMGRGCALEAKNRYPHLSLTLGEAIKEMGNHAYYFYEYNIITFPVKRVWWDPADPKLIVQSAHELMSIINQHTIADDVYLPRPGCGNGQLNWDDVKPLIKPILSDRVTVISF